jgi:hypothetical protein
MPAVFSSIDYGVGADVLLTADGCAYVYMLAWPHRAWALRAQDDAADVFGDVIYGVDDGPLPDDVV